jgi:hypothetical protein
MKKLATAGTVKKYACFSFETFVVDIVIPELILRQAQDDGG